MFDFFLTLYKLTSMYVGVSYYLQMKEECQEAAKKYAAMRHFALQQVVVFPFFSLILDFFEKSLTELFDFHHWSSWLRSMISER